MSGGCSPISGAEKVVEGRQRRSAKAGGLTLKTWKLLYERTALGYPTPNNISETRK